MPATKFVCKDGSKIWDGNDCVNGVILTFDTGS
jgi:hypothetical protein